MTTSPMTNSLPLFSMPLNYMPKTTLLTLQQRFADRASELADFLIEMDTEIEMLFIQTFFKDITRPLVATLVARAAKSLEVDTKRQQDWANAVSRADFSLASAQQVYRQVLTITNARQHTKPERILLIDAMLLAVAR